MRAKAWHFYPQMTPIYADCLGPRALGEAQSGSKNERAMAQDRSGIPLSRFALPLSLLCGLRPPRADVKRRLAFA